MSGCLFQPFDVSIRFLRTLTAPASPCCRRRGPTFIGGNRQTQLGLTPMVRGLRTNAVIHTIGRFTPILRQGTTHSNAAAAR
jgi:hypothetical protein